MESPQLFYAGGTLVEAAAEAQSSPPAPPLKTTEKGGRETTAETPAATAAAQPPPPPPPQGRRELLSSLLSADGAHLLPSSRHHQSVNLVANNGVGRRRRRRGDGRTPAGREKRIQSPGKRRTEVDNNGTSKASNQLQRDYLWGEKKRRGGEWIDGCYRRWLVQIQQRGRGEEECDDVRNCCATMLLLFSSGRKRGSEKRGE